MQAEECKGNYWDNCYGTYTFTGKFAGDKYIGEWKDDKMHGLGTYIFADGDKYVGEWKGHKMHGQGTYTYGPKSEWAGDEYAGEFKNNKRHGLGTYTYARGDMRWRI